MAMQEDDNVRLHREALEAFNSRDMDAVVRPYGEDIVVTDHAQHQTMKSADGIRSGNQAWIDGFSAIQRAQLDVCDVARWRDGKIVEQHLYYDMYGFLAQLGHLPPMTETG